MINTDKSSLLEIHTALTNFANSQLAYADNFQDVMSYYSNIILHMPGNVYWMDKDCITIGCNQNVLDMFKLSSIEEFVGLSFEDMARIGNWKDNQADSFLKDTMEVINSGKTKANVEEPPITYADGSTVYFLTTRVPIFNKNKEVIGIVGISTDITYRKVMEQALIKEKENAEVASKAKQQFLYNMRHDIRTPFTGIIGMAELLANIETNEKKLQYIDTIRTSSKCLLNYLNEILELAQVEDSKTPPRSERINLKDAVENCVLMFIPSFKEKEDVSFSVHYDPEVPKHLFTDEFRIKRILINLLGNAVKFTPKGKISLRVELEPPITQTSNNENVLVKLSIADTGIGISADKQSIIFEKFERVSPSYEGKYKGSGLGLFVVRSLIQDLGGEIKLTSELGKGSTFSCLIPMKITQGNNEEFSNKQNNSCPITTTYLEQNTALENTNNNIPRLLLVEDEPMVQIVASALFQILNCQLDIAETGEQALLKFQRNTYDLILMDIGLPDMDGYTVTKKIRLLVQQKQSEQKDRAVPIVAFTAHAKDDVENQCLLAGMNEVVSKPLSQAKARELLERYTQQQKN